jgi:hypothetical protein
MNIKYSYEKLQTLYKIVKGELTAPLTKYKAIEEFKVFVDNLNKSTIEPIYYKSKERLQHKNKVNKLLVKLLTCISDAEILQAKAEIEKQRLIYKAELAAKIKALDKQKVEKRKQTEKQLKEEIAELKSENKRLLQVIMKFHHKI